HTQSLFNARPRLTRPARTLLRDRSELREWSRLESLTLRAHLSLRLRASLSRYLQPQQATHSVVHPLRLTPRMAAHPAPMQPLHHRLRHKIFFWNQEAVFVSPLCLQGPLRTIEPRHSTPNPEKPCQIDTRGRRRFRAQHIRHIHPRAHFFRSRNLRDEGERQRRTPRALRTNHLGQSTHWQTTFEQLIHRANS